jgi:hypothetical protein
VVAIRKQRRVDPGCAAQHVVAQQLHHATEVAAGRDLIELADPGAVAIDVWRGEDRIVVPLGAVGVHHRQAARRRIDQRRSLVDHRVELVRREEQVAKFAQAVLVFQLKFRSAQNRRQKWFDAGACKGLGPGEIQIPRQDRPAAGFRVQVIVVVLAFPDVVVMDGFGDAAEAEIAGQVEVGAPPGCVGVAVQIAIHKGDEVGFVGDALLPFVVQFTGGAFHLVEVAVGQVVLVEKLAIDVLQRQVQPPEIAVVLAAGLLGRLIDDAEVDKVGGGGGHVGQVVEPIGQRLEQTLLAAIAPVGVLQDRGKDQLVPLHRVRDAIVVVGLETMAALKVELPVILAGGVPMQASPCAKTDMVVDDAIVDQRPQPGIVVAHVGWPRRGGDVLRVRHIGRSREQLVDRHRAHLVEGIALPDAAAACSARPDRPAPRRCAVIDIKCKVGLWIFPIGRGDRPPALIRCFDAIADQVAVDAHVRRHFRGIKIRPDCLHRHGRPVGAVGRVGEADVGAGRHGLQEEAHVGDAVGVADLGANLHRIERSGRRRQMLDGVDERGRVVQPGVVARAWRGAACAPCAGNVVVEGSVEQTRREIVVAAAQRPRKADAVLDAVDHFGSTVAQFQQFAFVGETPAEWPQGRRAVLSPCTRAGSAAMAR